MDLAYFFYIEFLQPLKKSSLKNPRSEDALTPLLYFVGVRLRQMCNCVICSRPCQSNAESAGMPRLETLVTRPDALNCLSHVTWVFRITLRSSVSKHLRFGISTLCRNVSFASAIPSHYRIIMSKYNHHHPKTFALCLSGCFNLVTTVKQNVILKSNGSRAQLK